MRIYYGAAGADLLNDFREDSNGILVVINEARRNEVLKSLGTVTDDVKARVITFESVRNENFKNSRDRRFRMHIEDADLLLASMFQPHEVRAASFSQRTTLVYDPKE
jgi:uncharacterized phosphosugar-binding protein